MTRVVVLGGYGNFGKRICECLVDVSGVELVVAGRNVAKAQQLCDKLKSRRAHDPSARSGQSPSTPSTGSGQAPSGPVGATPDFIELDIDARDFVARLRRAEPGIVIHTCGPFQGQDHRVANACLAVGSHYLDLADDRRFVCDIRRLDAAARSHDVLLVSGASTVPGLSSVVVDALRPKLARLDGIDIAIAPGNRAERGEATVRGILSYTGHPFSIWSGGKWRKVYGWMDNRREDFGDSVGRRWLANVDVPDLELFPERYAPVGTVRFQAGLELSVLHNTLRAMAWLARIRLVRDWARYARLVLSIDSRFHRLGTDVGGMRVRLTGADIDDNPMRAQWTLVAENAVGPYVPTISTIILARKLIRDELCRRGAVPCLGMYGLDEFSTEAERWNIRQRVETYVG